MNLFSLPPTRGEEAVERLAGAGPLRIERIVSRANASPPGFWYEQEEDEWVCLLQGSALLGFERYDVFLGPGDQLLLSAKRRHRVEATSADPAAVWLCVFGPAGSLGDVRSE